MKKRKMFTRISALSILLLVMFGQNSFAQNIQKIKLKDFEHVLNRQGDSIYVYNFFATWCKPCVKELPNFVKFANDSANTKINFSFVSMDELESMDEKVKPFVAKKKITQKVYMVEASSYDWLQRVYRGWGGSIPLTVVVNSHTGKRQFFEGELNYKELTQLINQTR